MPWDCVFPHEEGIFSGNVLDMFLEDRIVIQRNYNMSKIMALRAEYALSIKGMHSHKALFEYIESRRYQLFKEAIRMDRNKVHARRVYQLMRDHRYWTTSKIRGMKCSFGSLVRSLHMKLPQRAGFRFYVTVFKLFGI